MDREILIMTFHINIDPSLISEMSNAPGSPAIIPFTGEVRSEIFSGTILPGAADVQFTDRDGRRHMCAKYMFRGIDSKGNSCMLFVENNGCFGTDEQDGSPIRACPTFATDSQVLNEYLSLSTFRSEVHPSENGVDILIFDVGFEG